MTTRKVAIITGASRGIGAGLVAGYRSRDWAVVASARTIRSSQDPDLLTVAADITEPATAGRIIEAALDRFGRLDTLVNNAGVCIAKPFTGYTAADYAAVVGVSLTGFFWLTQRAIGEMAVRYGGHVVNVSATLAELADTGTQLLALTHASSAGCQTSGMSSLAGADVQALLADAAGRAGRYLAGLDERAVAPDDAALAGLARFDEPLPEVAGDPAGTLALLDEAGSAATVASAGGRYFGFVIGGSYPVAVAAAWLATAWDQDVALPVMSPVAARLHEVVTRWLADLLGLPPGTAAGFVSGASMANTTALTAARDHQLARAGWDVQADGLFGAPELTVVIGEYAHSTVVRALGLLGLGRNRVRRVPADDQGRMRADCLPEDVTGPVVICAQAGEVNTGAFDPFPAIGKWARRHQAWMHVDGAFGLWALTDPSRSHLTAGLAEADSWATDGHKWLNVPYDCGIALVRRPGDLRRSFTAAAGYLPPDTGFEAANLTPQSSQRARQVEVWAVLRTLGRAGVTDLITRTCRYAQTMAAHLSRAGLEVLNDVVLNQVLVRAATDDQTHALIAAVQQDGTCWCGPTVWQHRPAIRISVSGWATTAEDIRQSADAIIAAAQLPAPGDRLG